MLLLYNYYITNSHILSPRPGLVCLVFCIFQGGKLTKKCSQILLFKEDWQWNWWGEFANPDCLRICWTMEFSVSLYYGSYFSTRDLVWMFYIMKLLPYVGPILNINLDLRIVSFSSSDTFPLLPRNSPTSPVSAPGVPWTLMFAMSVERLAWPPQCIFRSSFFVIHMSLRRIDIQIWRILPAHNRVGPDPFWSLD